MKKPTLSIVLLVLFSVACGGKSKKSPVQAGPSGSQIPGDDAWANPEQDHDCNSISQNDYCNGGSPNQNLVGAKPLEIVSTRSWRATDESANGRIESSETCLGSLSSQGAQLILHTNNMALRSTSDRRAIAARCLVNAEVSYPVGYSFAIRRVSATVRTSIRANVVGTVQGAYKIGDARTIKLAQTFNRYGEQDNELQKDYKSDLVWSPCDGRASLALYNVLEMKAAANGLLNATNPSIAGSMSVDKGYRFDIVWTKCR